MVIILVSIYRQMIYLFQKQTRAERHWRKGYWNGIFTPLKIQTGKKRREREGKGKGGGGGEEGRNEGREK